MKKKHITSALALAVVTLLAALPLGCRCGDEDSEGQPPGDGTVPERFAELEVEQLPSVPSDSGTRGDSGPEEVMAFDTSPPARAGKVKRGTPRIVEGPGTVDTEEVKRAVGTELRSIKSCYEQQLAHAGTKGNIKARVSLTLSAGGKAPGPTVELERGSGTVAEPGPFQECLAAKIAAVSFPAPQKGAVKLELPFWFAPAGM